MGLRILELGDDTAAAFCGKLFARWGAEVIRVEPPGTPAPATSAERARDRYLHAGKRRVAIDLKTSAGRDLLEGIATRCDIAVFDEPPEVVDRLGLLDLGGEDAPGVRVSVTPYGLSGPNRDWQATTATLLAHGGYTFLMGDVGRAPLTMPGHYVEYQSAQFAYLAALSAHLGRQARGGGAPIRIEISMLEVLATLSQFTTVMWTFGGRIRSRHGNAWENLHPTTLYPVKDGWFGLNILPRFWEPFAMMIGHPELVADPRFATNADRMEHAEELDEYILDALGEMTPREVLLSAQDTWRVPVGAAVELQDLLDDPHLDARGFWRSVEGEAGADGSPLRLPGAPLAIVDDVRPLEPATEPPGTSTHAILGGAGQER